MMNKIGRKLVKDSLIKRKWTVLSNYSTTPSYVDPLEDTLLHKIEGDYKRNVERLNFSSLKNYENYFLKNIPENSENINAKNAIQTMSTFYEKCTENKDLSYEDLKRSNEFLHICKVVQKAATALDMYDVIYTLRILASLNVPTNTLLMQTLLQLIRVSVNDLSVGQIMTIHYTLSKIEECPLNTSIMIALRKVFKVQAEFELSGHSNNLLSALKFSCIINDRKTKQLIIDLLLKNSRAIDFNSIFDIFYTLYTLPKLDESSRTVLYKVISKIIVNATSFNINQIQQLLNYVSMKFRNSEFDFYDEKMINMLCIALLNKNTTFHMDIHILKQLNRMRYSSILFLDKLAQKCIDSDGIKKCSYIDINHIIQGFMIADYRPNCWPVMKTMIEDFVNNMDYSLQNGAYLAFHLLSLECYCPRLLEKVFTLYRKVPNDIKTKNVISITLKLHWCVKLFYPEYNGIMIDENKVQQALIDKLPTENKKNYCSSVMESLEEAVGGAEYITRGLRTKFGDFVDYVVVLQPNGTPMNISQCDSAILLEELEPQSNCTKIPIVVCPKYEYSTNGRNMSSTVKMELKAIEMLSGLRPFVINPYLWDQLSSIEKVLHLRDAIKPICNNIRSI